MANKLLAKDLKHLNLLARTQLIQANLSKERNGRRKAAQFAVPIATVSVVSGLVGQQKVLRQSSDRIYKGENEKTRIFERPRIGRKEASALGG